MLKRVRLNKYNSATAVKEGQAMLEYTVTMILMFLLIFGMVRIFMWAGQDSAGIKDAYQKALTETVVEDYGACYDCKACPLGECKCGFNIRSGGCLPCEDECKCGCNHEMTDVSDGPVNQLQTSVYRPSLMNAVWPEASF